MIYLVIGFILIIFSYLEVIQYKRWFSVLFLVIFCILLVLFAALRDGSVVGTDSPNYFLNYKYSYWQTEPGYKYLNYFFGQILRVNYNIFLFFLNGVSLFLMGKYFKNNAVFYVLPILIFYSDLYLYFNISGIRQGMAISFTCFSVYYAYTKQLKKFLFVILIAALFHVSALIFIFAYFLPHKILKLKHSLILISVFIVVGLLGNFLSTKFEYLSTKADYYSKYQVQSSTIEIDYAVGIAKRAIIVFLTFLFRKNLFKNSQFIYYFNIYLVGFLIFMSTYLISPDFGSRFSVYYTIIDCVLAGLMLYLVKDVRKRFVIVTVFSLISIYKLVGYMNNDYYIYKFIFENIL